MACESTARLHVIARGRVQGVFFRAETSRIADSLGLSGWVRNMPDGSVEAVFEGDRKSVESAVEWSGRGPRFAIVESLDVENEEPTGEHGFEIRS